MREFLEGQLCAFQTQVTRQTAEAVRQVAEERQALKGWTGQVVQQLRSEMRELPGLLDERITKAEAAQTVGVMQRPPLSRW